MKLRKFLYVSTGNGVNGADEALLLPVDKITGIEVSDFSTNSPTEGQGAEIVLNVAELDDEHASKVGEDYFTTLFCNIKEAIAQVCAALNSNPKNGFIVFDEDTNYFSPTGKNVIKRVHVDTVQ